MLKSIEFQPLSTVEDDDTAVTSSSSSSSSSTSIAAIQSSSPPRKLKLAYFVGNCLILNLPYIPFQLVIGPHWPGVFVAMLTNIGGTMLFNQVLRLARRGWYIPVLRTNVIVMFCLVNFFLILTSVLDPGIVYSNDYQIQQIPSNNNNNNDNSNDNSGNESSSTVIDASECGPGTEIETIEDATGANDSSRSTGSDIESNIEAISTTSNNTGTTSFYAKRKKMKQNASTVTADTTTSHHQNGCAPSVPHTYCDICNVYQVTSKRILHCQECNVCILGLDHHCPWMGKCIGKRNMTVFSIFNCCWILYMVELLACVMLL